MNFYRLTSSHVGGRQFPWAGSFGPLDPIEEMLFLKDMPESFRATKIQSWEMNKRPPGLEIDPGGRTWSDFIGCGTTGPPHFVSERVIHDLSGAHIPIFRTTEMPIAKIAAKALQKIEPPKYFVLEAAPGLEIWSENVPIEVQIAARNEDPPRWISPCLMKCKPSTWNGADLFSPAHGKSSMLIFCTEKVKELAESKGWTNVKFDPVLAL